MQYNLWIKSGCQLNRLHIASTRGLSPALLVYRMINGESCLYPKMLHEFISRNRQELIELCRAKVASRLVHAATPVELEHGVPLFLDQLVKTLQFEEAESAAGVRRISGRFGATQPDRSEMAAAARMHGRDLLKFGFSLQQVVYDYGDIC